MHCVQLQVEALPGQVTVGNQGIRGPAARRQNLRTQEARQSDGLQTCHRILQDKTLPKRSALYLRLARALQSGQHTGVSFYLPIWSELCQTVVVLVVVRKLGSKGLHSVSLEIYAVQQILHNEVSVADLHTKVSSAPPPKPDPILSFLHTFHIHFTHVRG